MFAKRDCFAYCNGDCCALNTMVCTKGECGFYKTRQALYSEREAARSRVAQLLVAGKIQRNKSMSIDI